MACVNFTRFWRERERHGYTCTKNISHSLQDYYYTYPWEALFLHNSIYRSAIPRDTLNQDGSAFFGGAHKMIVTNGVL